ncbi:MAG TPA: MerR family transcriptional regulator [bacterium]|nr:MerR family transcriptional regulator [bacterium]
MHIKETPAEPGHAPGGGIGFAGELEGPLHRMEDVVKRTGLTPRAIRYYEEVGLLTAASRTAGGFRLFTEADVALLQRIKELQTLLGFSLAEIKETLRIDAVRAEIRQAYEQATDARTRLGLLDRAEPVLHSQLALIDERVGRLTQLRTEYAERLARLRTLREQIRTGDATEPAR